MRTVLILGSSGLVGQHLLAGALADASIGQVVAPTRRPLPAHAKLLNPIVSYDALPAAAPWWRADAVLCALGTTMAQAGSQAVFRQVDHDYVMAAATLAQRAGTPVFVLNSSLGANVMSRAFYTRVKGEVERDLGGLGFVSMTTVRPALLDGGPRPDKRRGERIGLWLAHRLTWLIPARYRAVSTQAVAGCMLAAARGAAPGHHVVESEQIGPNGR